MECGLTNERLEIIERLSKKYYWKDINIRIRMEYEDFFNSVIVKLLQPSPKNNGLNVLQLFDERQGTAIASYLSSIINRYTIDISRSKAMPSSLDAIPDVHDFMEELSTTDIEQIQGVSEDLFDLDVFDYIDNEPLEFKFLLHSEVTATFRLIASLLANGYRYNDLLRLTDDKKKFRQAYTDLKDFMGTMFIRNYEMSELPEDKAKRIREQKLRARQEALTNPF